MGIKEPTQVQEAAIPKVLAGTNVAIQCYTGSGKVHSQLASHSGQKYVCLVLRVIQAAEAL